MENFRFGMTKVYSEIPPPPFWKSSDLGWPKFTLKYPPPLWKTSDSGWPKFTLKYPPSIMENFRFGMTKVYSEIPPLPPILENFRFGMTKVYSEIPPTHPPIMENFRFGMTKVYSEIPPTSPHYGKLQIWDDQSLLRNTPPPLWKTSDLGWPKFTPKYPPIMENFRLGMTKVYSEIPPTPIYGKLQIWDDQSLLRNTPLPPILENFRFGMTKVYSEIAPHLPPFWKTSDLGWPMFTPK